MEKKWESIKTECMDCERCDLCKTRTNVVFGVGNPNAEVMFIGEGPGENEDIQGEPFVGRAGKLLDKLLFAVDLDRHSNIYITNIVKCRPPKNRDPFEDEQIECMDWLRAQTRYIRPKIIVCLGRIAAMKIIKSEFKITKEHGIFFEKNGIHIMAMYHPAAILRNPNQMEDALKDFIILREKIKQICDHTY
ncbi:MAG: uracil-DNA glycosylase [Eubacteriales bacterium]|nr:uracil-DNA glycosylase [Eubacteriales bacterium]